MWTRRPFVLAAMSDYGDQKNNISAYISQTDQRRKSVLISLGIGDGLKWLNIRRIF
jgi:hypothetical protein